MGISYLKGWTAKTIQYQNNATYQISDSLQSNGEPPIGDHGREVSLLILVDDQLRLPDELVLKE